MPILTVRADAVRAGDELYDRGYYMTRFGRPWVRVTRVEQAGEYVVLTTDSYATWKHPGEGVAVRRGE